MKHADAIELLQNQMSKKHKIICFSLFFDLFGESCKIQSRWINIQHQHQQSVLSCVFYLCESFFACKIQTRKIEGKNFT